MLWLLTGRFTELYIPDLLRKMQAFRKPTLETNGFDSGFCR